MEFKTKDGWKLRVFSSMYMDWGLEITRPDGEDVYYSPCALSNESYGRNMSDRFVDWEDAETAAMDGDDTAFVEWTDDDWKKMLENEADELIDAFVGWHEISILFGGNKGR